VKKTRLIKTFIVSFIISSLVSCSPQKQKFKVDNSISPGIDSIFKVYGVFDSSSERGILFHVKRTFDYERFAKNPTDLAYFLKADTSKSTEVYVGGGSECHLDKDTITLIAILNYEYTIGLKISIFDDKFNSQLRLIATEKIYSKSEKKNYLQEEIILNPDSISLILTGNPNFKTGSRLKGKMEVKFEPFYQIDSSNRLSKIDPQFKIIFNNKIL
jgi:hypothetical protein